MDQRPASDQRQPSAAYVVIPARLESTRLPLKLLLNDTGKPLIQHTYEAAATAQRPQGILVAADHPEIVQAVQRFGGDACLTNPAASSGTDRVAEVAKSLSASIVVNLQGDEPELSGNSIDDAIALLDQRPDVPIATLAAPIRSRQQLLDPACVKVVCNRQGLAMYFSRSPIPAVRQWDDGLLDSDPPQFLQHIGLYVYRREFLLHLAELPGSSLERVECLEQLRVLDAGFPIAVGVIPEATTGIDTPADYRAFVERYRRRTIASKVA